MGIFNNLSGTFQNLFSLGKSNKVEIKNNAGDFEIKSKSTDTLYAKNHIVARIARNPLSTDDGANTSTVGYSFKKGDQWQNSTSGEIFTCIDNTTSAAIWKSNTSSGIANFIIETLKNSADLSLYKYLTWNVFETDAATKTDTVNSTGAYLTGEKGFKLSAIGQIFYSLNLLDNDFYASEVELDEIRFDIFWDLANIDTAATYWATREGSAATPEYQQITMERDGISDRYTGVIRFVDEAANSLTQSISNTGGTLNASNYIDDDWTLANPSAIKKLSLDFTKTGTPSGNIRVRVAKDDAGSPDFENILYDSNWIGVSTISTGTKVLLPYFIANAQDLHILVESDAAYKASYVAATHQLAVDASSEDIEGRELDLRIKVIAGTANKNINGMGAFYNREDAGGNIINSLYPMVAYVKDVKSSGTQGGTFTSGAWQTRVLNTLEGETSFIFLSANQLTLQAGEYDIDGLAPAYSVNYHKAKLRDITNGTDAILGSDSYDETAHSGRSFIKGKIIINIPTTFEIQHRCSVTKSTDGFGEVSSGLGVSGLFTQVKITKLK